MPRLKQEVLVHLQKARESALLAVETYNRPKTSFRSGGFIVLMCIAWTALFHAVFFARGIKPFYRKKTHRRHFEVLDGDRKAWELSQCAAEFWRDQNPPERVNLEFFIKLRNKIEHRSMPALDLEIFGECQALLFNFEDLLVQEFGERFALHESLSLALQFSCFRNEHQEAAIRKLHGRMAKDIVAYVEHFRSSLSAEQLQDMRFSYKVFLFPKPANRERGADLAVEFVKYDPGNPEEMARINRAIALIKNTQAATPQTVAGLANGADGVQVRLVTDPNVPAIRAIDYDLTHPYRQKDLLARLDELLPQGPRLSTYDLTAIRYSHAIVERPEYYHKARFGSAQYSEQYAQWIVASMQGDRDFIEGAREHYYEDHH
jgi:Protein of unknown function (DUF3644)